MREIDVVDEKTFNKEVGDIKHQLEYLINLTNKKIRKEHFEIGKKTIKLEDLKKRKEKSPLEEVMEG